MNRRALPMLARRLMALWSFMLVTMTVASAGIQVNKSFAPNSVALGGTSTVTVTLQNASTSAAATITAFSDDVGTTMAGHARLLSSPSPATTCAGGTPAISGGVLSMNGGVIPRAPTLSTPGSCTITFSVVGAATGNGFNTIAAANVVTSLGSPSNDVTQTLNVQGATATVTATSAGTVQTSDTSTVTYAITNPAAVPLTNAAFSINANASSTFVLSAFTTSCGGTATLSPAGTVASANFSGLTIPANSTCTVTLNVSSSNVTTVNFTLPAGSLSDDQGAGNMSGSSAQARFVNGQPNVSKSFSPSAVAQGGTTTLTVNVQNVLTDKPLMNAALSDTLPAGLTISGTPSANSYCGTPVLGGSGTGTLSFSGGTIAANHTCSIAVAVLVPGGQAPGQLTNTIPASGAGSFTSGEANGSAATATAGLYVTGPGGGITTGMTVNGGSSASAGLNTPVVISLSFHSIVNGTFSAGTFSDTLPQSAVPFVALTDPSHTPVLTNCGPNAAVTFGGAGGNTTLSGSSLSIAANGTCSVTFSAVFTSPAPASRVDTNALPAANVTFTGTSGAVHPAQNVAVTITELPTLSATNYVASNSGPPGQPLTMQVIINDPSGTADTNAVAVVSLSAGKVKLAATPNFTFGAGCPAGLSAASISPSANREQFNISIGALNASCTIGYDVVDEGGALGTFTPGNTTYSSTLTANTPVATTGQNNVTFATTAIDVTKSFSPNQIQSGGTSTVDIALSVPQAGTLARTQVNGVAFNDALPANMTFSAAPNVVFGAGCEQTGQTAPAFTIAGTTIAVSNVSLLTVGAVQTTCHVRFDVTSGVVGAPLNTIAAGSIVASPSGIANVQSARASLTVNAGLNIAKTFSSATLPIGGTDYVRFLITNSASAAALTGGTLVDTMPGSLVLASTALGTAQAGDPALCGGAVSGPAGTSLVQLSGLAIAGSTGPATPGRCVVYVAVRAGLNAGPGTVTNTIGIGALNAGGYSNQTGASATVTLTAAPNPVLSKSFAPSAIAPNASSVLSILIANTASGAAELSGMSLTDTLPAGLHIAAVPSAATTCGVGATPSAAPGATSVALSNASVHANATCTLSVNVTGSSGGTYVNTIAPGALSTTQGASNATAATATLAIGSVTLSEAFAPVAIPAGGVSTLSITLPSGSVALSGMALSDSLPAGATIAANPNATTTCGGGTVSATPGATSFALSGGSVAGNSACTIVINVTAAVAATYTNVIASGALSTSQGITNPAPVAAAFSVTGATALTLSKAFVAPLILSGGTSVYTLTIVNAAPGAQPLTGLGLSDTLPAGVSVAAVPNAGTSCGGGTLAANPGATSLALAGGTLGAGATCTISLSVTSAVAGSHVDTSPAGTVLDTQGVTNPAPAGATLTVSAGPAVGLTQAFSLPAIPVAGTSVLTISLANTAPGAVPLSGLALSDVLPAGVVLAATPAATTTCPAGRVSGVAGASTFGLAAATLAAGASCTLRVTVTSSTPGAYTNALAAGSLTSAQGAVNATATQAVLEVVAASLRVTKTSDVGGADVSPGSTIAYTVTITNAAPVAETNATVNDVLTNATLVPGTVRVNGVPAADAVIARGAPFGSIAPGATATIVYRATVSSGSVGRSVTNVATAGGDQGCAGTACSAGALADAVQPPPSVGVSLLIDGRVSETVSLGQTVTYSATVTNLGRIVANNVSFRDTVPAGVTPIAGSGAATVAGQIVTASLGSIAPGASVTVVFQASITSPIPTVVANTVSVAANGIPAAVISNTVVANMVAAVIAVTKTAGVAVAHPGDRIDYTLRLTAPPGVAFGRTTIVDRLPGGLAYAPGTARINGTHNEPAVSGQTLTWSIPALSAPLSVSYATSIAAGVAFNASLTNVVNVNAASLVGGPPGTGNATASVQIAASTFGSCYPITGRVFDDVKGSGRFERGDRGLSGVRLVLEDGETVTTDAQGRYDFACVRPGLHALRLDEQSLPAGSAAYPDRAIDSERSTRRLIHSTFDATIVQDVNFAIGSAPR